MRVNEGEPSSFFFVPMIYGRFFRPPISLEAEHSNNSLYDFWRESRRHKKTIRVYDHTEWTGLGCFCRLPWNGGSRPRGEKIPTACCEVS